MAINSLSLLHILFQCQNITEIAIICDIMIFSLQYHHASPSHSIDFPSSLSIFPLSLLGYGRVGKMVCDMLDRLPVRCSALFSFLFGHYALVISATHHLNNLSTSSYHSLSPLSLAQIHCTGQQPCESDRGQGQGSTGLLW